MPSIELANVLSLSSPPPPILPIVNEFWINQILSNTLTFKYPSQKNVSSYPEDRAPLFFRCPPPGPLLELTQVTFAPSPLLSSSVRTYFLTLSSPLLLRQEERRLSVLKLSDSFSLLPPPLFRKNRTLNAREEKANAITAAAATRIVNPDSLVVVLVLLLLLSPRLALPIAKRTPSFRYRTYPVFAGNRKGSSASGRSKDREVHTYASLPICYRSELLTAGTRSLRCTC